MIKKIFFLIVIFAYSVLSYAQYIPEEEESEKDKNKDKKEKKEKELKKPQDRSNFVENLFVGGDFNIFANSFNFLVEVGPKVGYRIFPFLSAGVGVRYQYYKSSLFNSNTFGGGLFASAYPLDFLILHAEYERLNLKAANPSSTQTFRTDIDVLWAGIGYRNNLTKRLKVNLTLLYDFVNDDNSPFPYFDEDFPVIYRFSIEYDLFE